MLKELHTFESKLSSLGGVLASGLGTTRRRIAAAFVVSSAVGLVVASVLGIIGDSDFDGEPPQVGERIELVEASDLQIDENVDVRTKKETFFDFLRPVIRAENVRIGALRERIVTARESGDTADWIPEVADRYGVEWTGEEWDALLKAADIVPLPLALAQAANESNWGTSRFAQEGNNMFGQWCFTEGCGMVPNRRGAGKRHEVRSFETVNHAVRSYFTNINTSDAYRELRELRWQARQEGRKPEASELVAGLGRYSERGAEYISEIRSMIRVNHSLMVGEAETSES